MQAEVVNVLAPGHHGSYTELGSSICMSGNSWSVIKASSLLQYLSIHFVAVDMLLHSCVCLLLLGQVCVEGRKVQAPALAGTLLAHLQEPYQGERGGEWGKLGHGEWWVEGGRASMASTAIAYLMTFQHVPA